MSYLHLPSTAVGDTTPIDDPSNCECGGKGCDCACHVPTRDNTVTDDDLERDALKHENMALEHEAKDLRGQLDDVSRMLDAANARGAALVVERDSLAATVEEYARNGWASVISKLWGAGDFCGPCAHGRDPYTRCDECEDLTPREALERVLLAPVTAELAALKAEFAHRTDLERDAAVEHLDEFAPLGLVDGVKAMRVALITLRTELAATRAGVAHLQTSLQRANARIDALATESAGLLRERNDLRELLRMAGVTP